MMRIVYMGTPDFAATVLRALLSWRDGQVLAVYCQPDRPCGRGQVCQPGPVKRLALERGLPVCQPRNFKADEDVAALAALKPDVLVVAAYGLILPQRVLDIPRLMPVNVHASLLPKYRGAAPIQRAVLNGERVTGITIMRMTAGLDEGPALLSRALKIAPDETAADLHDQLAELGGNLAVEALARLADGRLAGLAQDPEQATYAAKLTKAEGHILWDRPAQAIHNQVRAMLPWPGAYFFWERDGQAPLRLSLTAVGQLGPAVAPGTRPGTLLGLEGDRLAIACQDRAYLLPGIKPEGKKAMDARAFVCGYLPDGAPDGVCFGEGLAAS